MIRTTAANNTAHSQPSLIEKVTMALRDSKPRKAPGFVETHPEFLFHRGKFAKSGLAPFVPSMMQNYPIPLKRQSLMQYWNQGNHAKDQSENAYSLMGCWREEWAVKASPQTYNSLGPPSRPPRFSLFLRAWTTLKRNRTGHCWCVDSHSNRAGHHLQSATVALKIKKSTTS